MYELGEVVLGEEYFTLKCSHHQVDEKDTQMHSNEPVDEHKERKKRKKEINKFAEEEKKKYRGYEELIDTDDEVLEGEELPKVQG